MKRERKLDRTGNTKLPNSPQNNNLMDGFLRAAERHVFKMFVINGNNQNNAGDVPIFIRTYQAVKLI